MRGAGDGTDLLAFEIFGADLRHHRLAPRHETRRRAVIGIGEIDPGAQLRRYRHRRDNGVAAVTGDGVDQRFEPAHLDGAGDLDLVAKRARQIDVEASGIAVGPGKVERGVIRLGQKPDHCQARQIGPVRAPPRVPEPGYCLGCGLDRGSRRGLGVRRAGRTQRQRSRDRHPGQQVAHRSGQSGVGREGWLLWHGRRFCGIGRRYRPSGPRCECRFAALSAGPAQRYRLRSTAASAGVRFRLNGATN